MITKVDKLPSCAVGFEEGGEGEPIVSRQVPIYIQLLEDGCSGDTCRFHQTPGGTGPATVTLRNSIPIMLRHCSDALQWQRVSQVCQSAKASVMWPHHNV